LYIGNNKVLKNDKKVTFSDGSFCKNCGNFKKFINGVKSDFY
jgi:hypothetical protein